MELDCGTSQYSQLDSVHPCGQFMSHSASDPNVQIPTFRSQRATSYYVLLTHAVHYLLLTMYYSPRRRWADEAVHSSPTACHFRQWDGHVQRRGA